MSTPLHPVDACYNHLPGGGDFQVNDHGHIAGDTIILNPYGASWIGDHYETLTVNGTVFDHPAAGTAYGVNAPITAWRVCKATTPEGDTATTTTAPTTTTTVAATSTTNAEATTTSESPTSPPASTAPPPSMSVPNETVATTLVATTAARSSSTPPQLPETGLDPIGVLALASAIGVLGVVALIIRCWPRTPLLELHPRTHVAVNRRPYDWGAEHDA